MPLAAAAARRRAHDQKLNLGWSIYREDRYDPGLSRSRGLIAMALRVTFDLEDKDLKFFRDLIKKAQAVCKGVAEDEIIEKAVAAVKETRDSGVPAFVRQRLDQIQSLVDMLRDQEWNLEAKERQNVLAALAYFANPEDLIPDSIPVLGYIDDAIMIELVVKELRPEIEAFADFSRYRRELASRNRNPNVTREQWLEAKRQTLQDRMRRRRRQAILASGPSTPARFRLF